MWAKSATITLVAPLVFLRETPEDRTTIHLDAAELHRILLYRLEVLEAAMRELDRLEPKQLKMPGAQQPGTYRGE